MLLLIGAAVDGAAQTVTLESQIAASSDDAEERASGSVKLGSSDLELVWDKSDQTVGLRFNGVDIPQGATILNAFVQFEVDEPSTEATSLTIQGEDADHAATFIDSNGNITSRPRTTAAVPWSPPEWPTRQVAGVDQQTERTEHADCVFAALVRVVIVQSKS